MGPDIRLLSSRFPRMRVLDLAAAGIAGAIVRMASERAFVQ